MPPSLKIYVVKVHGNGATPNHITYKRISNVPQSLADISQTGENVNRKRKEKITKFFLTTTILVIDFFEGIGGGGAGFHCSFVMALKVYLRIFLLFYLTYSMYTFCEKVAN